jgi:hypothetical protein
MHKIAKSDVMSEYGFRCANAGDVSLLEGFDYNHLLGFDGALPVKPTHSMDATTGTLHLHVPACTVEYKTEFPETATHFRIVSCAAALDFNRQCFVNDVSESDYLPLDEKLPAIDLSHAITVTPGQVMVHTIGIVFYTVSEGKMERLRGGALKIVQVARVKSAESPSHLRQDFEGRAGDSAEKEFLQATPVQDLSFLKRNEHFINSSLVHIHDFELEIVPQHFLAGHGDVVELVQ